MLAFRAKSLVAILQLEVQDDLIVDIHAIADPAKLALVGKHLSLTTADR